MNFLDVMSYQWIVEAGSQEEFLTSLAGSDLPINSNVMIFSGNISERLDIWDVYRTQPSAEMR